MHRLIIILISVLTVFSAHAEDGPDGFALRLLNHWDNPDGTVERGYAGRSIWKWDSIPADDGVIPQSLRLRYEQYGQMNQEIGINGVVLNNVNAKPVMLHPDMIRKTAKIADVLRPYGIKVYLSVNFASPKALGELPTADPLDKSVRSWWVSKANEIYALIPDFGGFLVKANSEGEPGPMDYGRTHVDGANMLAEALKPHRGIVMWRAFVYNAKGGDRASQAVEEFLPFDGQFADNVIIQIKNGPVDFQPREPVSPLFFALKKTNMMAELQITQEYTGHSIHTCYLGTQFAEFFKALEGVDGSGAEMVNRRNLIGVAGVANIGDDDNWTGNDLARANWYAFGRMTSDRSVTARQAAEEFLMSEYTKDQDFVRPMAQLLMKSHEAVVDYMMPLGLHHIFAGGHHYGPEPWYAPEGCREDWLPRYYHKADKEGLGFNRTGTGSNNTAQYPEPLRTIYDNVELCPENLLLWFHHVSWNHVMHNGLSLWDNLCYTYDRGVAEAQTFVDIWRTMKPYVDSVRYERQLKRFERQAMDAWWWRDACLLYFQQFSGKPLPVDSPRPLFRLDDLMSYHLDIDNYTAPVMDELPCPSTVSQSASPATSLRVPGFFSDGMILMRDTENPVWGWGSPGQTVSVSFNGETVTTTVKSDGTWRVCIPEMSADDEGLELYIQASNPSHGESAVSSLKIKDVLIGDVFLCSGQSNMELPIRRCMDVVADDVKDYSNRNIRYLKLPHQFNYVRPADDVKTYPWQDITPDNCGEVSAICYFIARELQEKENVPIGIINSSVGGTRVEAWTPQHVLKAFPEFADEFSGLKYHQENWADSVRSEESRLGDEWERRTMENDTIAGRWREVGYDFSSWQDVDIFGDWFDGNGSYWFRKTVDIPSSLAGKEAVIRLGAMKDADTVYVNGRYIGNTTYQYPPRIYRIPGGLLKEGENEIMVHLTSQNGEACFTQDKLYQIEVGDTVISLLPAGGGQEDTPWKMAQGSRSESKPGSTYFVDGNTGLYNAMIAPLRDIRLKGILWYQGESNLGNASVYSEHLAAMIQSWRQQFGEDSPVVIVQLPGYMSHHERPYESAWTQIRQQQFAASRDIGKAALVSILDTGEWNDIHPQDKKTAGHRAALQMRHLAYGEKMISEGPSPVSAKIKKDKAVIHFSKKTGRLDRTIALKTISVRVGDRYQWAEAEVTGDYTISVALPGKLAETTIRYCWDDYPEPTIYNVEGLPAPQFQITAR